MIYHLKRLINAKEITEEDAIKIIMIIWYGGTDSTNIFTSRIMYELIKDELIVEKIKYDKNLQFKFIEECFRLYPPF